jgi:hypothetical protein
MPYDNDMNRAVKRDIDMINKKYIAHTDMLGSTNAINWLNPAVEPQGAVMYGMGHERIVGGGVGCADFQRSSASKHYDEDKDGMSGGAILGLQDGTLAGDRTKPISRVRKFKANKDNDNRGFGALGNSMPSDIGLSDQNIPAAEYQQGFAQKDTSPLQTQPESFARAAGIAGAGRRRTKKVPCPCGAKTKKKCMCMEGGNGFATGTHMDTGFGTTLGAEDNGGVKNTGNLSMADVPRKKLRGRGNAKVGGAILGLLKPPVQGKLDATEAEKKPAPGVAAKRTKQSTAKKQLDKPVEKSQMPSSTLSGMGKRQARAEIVKKVMKEKGLSLPQASKYVKEHNLF